MLTRSSSRSTPVPGAQAPRIRACEGGAIAAGIPVITRPAVGYRQRKDRRLEPDPGPRRSCVRRSSGAPRARGRPRSARSCNANVSDVAGLEDVEQAGGHGLLRTASTSASSPTAATTVTSTRTRTSRSSTSRCGPQRSIRTRQIARPHRSRRLPAVRACCAAPACRYCCRAPTTSRGKRIYRCTRAPLRRRVPGPGPRARRPRRGDGHRGVLEPRRGPQARGTTDTGRRSTGSRRRWTRPSGRSRSTWLRMFRKRSLIRPCGRRGSASAARRATVPRKRSGVPARLCPPISDLTSTAARGVGAGTTAERRELLAARFDCFAAYRDPVVLVGYPAGTAPRGLPRQGFKVAPEFVPFPRNTPLAHAKPTCPTAATSGPASCAARR